ncbi:hypothetical protein BJ138DRAFT_1155782 [Hygrophoropsis aurantiaca]|uniref:Uncharacterized protein n=1 Tax=Hygrophoropsis aurantiaca TaxID=72124 RepID=A0ACB8A951_9AGAM|nr:hypothetical protein BJ138DRAFT_1155782 [Hygrophoropsis aurantiaca]
MLISEKELLKAQDLGGIPTEQPQPTEDPTDDTLPPPYVENPLSPSVLRPPPNIRPTNFVLVNEKDLAIKESYAIDPTIFVPRYTPPNPKEYPDGERRNLDIRSRDGHVEVQVWLVHPEDAVNASSGIAASKKRTTMYLYARDGNVTASVNTVPSSAPFFLDIYARDGRVTVLLPRSFSGPLKLNSRDGPIVLSDGLLQRSALLSNVDRTRIYFVGDVSNMSEDNWQGDELNVEARDGKIKVRYVDEIETQKGGFLGRIFHR